MSHSRRRTESEKSHIDEPINLESLEAQDVITPLSPIRSVHRRTSLGKLPPPSISLSQVFLCVLTRGQFAMMMMTRFTRRRRLRKVSLRRLFVDRELMRRP